MIKASELRDKTVEELELASFDISKELFELNNELRINRKLEKPHILKEKKRDRAKVLTVLREKTKEGRK